MRIFSLTLLTLLFTCTQLEAQTEPKIGSEKGVKEKLTRIKNGLPDMKKTLTKEDEMWIDQYNVNFEMGNGIVLFKEEDGLQTMQISYSKSYFSGTVTDYQNYFKVLAGYIKNIFGNSYDSDSTNTSKKWVTTFFQKGKDKSKSPITVHLSCNWMLKDLGPEIEIAVCSRLKPPTYDQEEDDENDN
ncbi:MAG: hypothetical protein JST10_01005 [Bacteroidetes bacterium]|nr:hypothetical protein [Bacteroidota bacterium]MBS1631129.1 hypothetical protein [Bacteroidota bacterium]